MKIELSNIVLKLIFVSTFRMTNTFDVDTNYLVFLKLEKI